MTILRHQFPKTAINTIQSNIEVDDEKFRTSSISNQLAYKIGYSGVGGTGENWLEHEVQPTDSEIESLYKDRSARSENSKIQRGASQTTFTNSDCETMEEQSEHNSISNRLSNSFTRSIIDLSEPMTREELLETISTLRDVFHRKYGEYYESRQDTNQSMDSERNPHVSHQIIEKIDNDIHDLKFKLIKLSLEQQRLKESIGFEVSINTIDPAFPIHNENGCNKMFRSASTASSELRTPSPRDTSMFIPLDQDIDVSMDVEEKLKQRDKLILKQLQRRENLLQRRIQRVTEKQYLEDERRLQEQWVEKNKADHEIKRNLILQSHQLEKKEENNADSNYYRSRNKLNSVLNESDCRGSDMRDSVSKKQRSAFMNASISNGGAIGRSPSIISPNRFMAPTTASQKRMNRAASLMSGLNQCDINNSISNLNSNNSGSMHNLFLNKNGSNLRLNQLHIEKNLKLKANDINRRFSINGDLNTRMTESTISLASQSGRLSQGIGNKSASKTNRHYMINAITHVSLAGPANRKQREAVLQEIEGSCARHFMFLFRDHRLLYRALYTYSNDSPTVEKIHGIGPMCINESMIEKFYKYNSGNRSFVFIPAKRFSIQCDAFIIQDEYWHKRNTLRR